MKNKLSSIHLPFSAIILSLATLGNILSEYVYIRNIVGIICGILSIIFVIRILINTEKFKTELNNPIIVSVLVTFPMALVVLSTYIKPLSNILGVILWAIGLLTHLAIIIYSLVKFIIPSKKILPSHYVTFVGIAVASVTSPMFGLQKIGFIIFIFAFIFFCLLTIPIFRNLFKQDFIPKVAQHTKAIVAAPLSLCLLGYLNSAQNISMNFAYSLFIFAFFLTILGIYFIFSTINTGFYPTFAAYTFPMVISCFATKKMLALTTNLTFQPIISIIYKAELIIAIIIVIYVLIKYILDFIKN